MSERTTRYCDECEKITPSLFQGDDKSCTECCSVCEVGYMFSIGEYECPDCGFFDENPHEDNVSYGPQHYNHYVTMEYGVTAYDWEETHTCPICGKEYSFSNSNC